ncbi:DNA cytosine methyltransferase [Streptomyces sioyaensis]|uniref:DNA cytosine methyltransferase n=1 Tax=Streptomyces sioyaensis TaxID=67364 RepID=UPI001F1EB2F5|nr:DNA cytosine methyltransferase [Streptomyces sioyaensis]MCF3178164.1 DNA cytosine methyltransferase [Streptomyces sioyaensis]
MTPTAIDLFSGCGGLSTGLLDAGVQVVAGFDKDAPSIRAFDYNHSYRGCSGHILDLAAASGEDLLKLAGVREVDILAGGPPCQSYSIAGKRMGLEDERGGLVHRFADLVREIRPRVALFENVPNFARFDEGRVLNSLIEMIEQSGYTVRHAILNAADYGVPQGRKRVFVVGIAGKRKDFDLPPLPTHSEAPSLFDETQAYRTAEDAIGDLPDVWEEAAKGIPNHEPTMHSEKMLEAFSRLEPGMRDKKSFHDRLHPERPSFTLRAGSGNFSPLRPVHYRYDRVVTVRESARIQGFEDSFIWPDPLPRLQQYRQVGNAVPPPLARAVIEHIARYVGWELKPEKTKGDSSTRPPAFTTTHEDRHADRMTRLRGASLGRG